MNCLEQYGHYKNGSQCNVNIQTELLRHAKYEHVTILFSFSFNSPPPPAKKRIQIAHGRQFSTNPEEQ